MLCCTFSIKEFMKSSPKFYIDKEGWMALTEARCADDCPDLTVIPHLQYTNSRKTSCFWSKLAYVPLSSPFEVLLSLPPHIHHEGNRSLRGDGGNRYALISQQSEGVRLYSDEMHISAINRQILTPCQDTYLTYNTSNRS